MTSMDLSKSSTEQQGNTPVPTKLTNAKMALHYGLSKFNNNKKILIIITVLHFVAVPIFLLSLMLNIASQGNQEPDAAFFIIGSISTAIGGLAGIVVAINNFDHYYKKSCVDKTLSLPITFKARFLSDFISGIVTYIAPFIAIQILSTIMFGVGHLVFDGKMNIITNRSSVIFDNAIPEYEMCSIFSEMFPYYIKLALGGILVMLFLYTLTVFVISCCGNIFEAGAYTLLINGLIPATIAVICFMLLKSIYGIDNNEIALKLLLCTSPAGCAAGLISYVTGANYYYYDGSFSFISNWLTPIISITTVLFIISYFLCKKRKAEDVGRPFVYKSFYYIIITMITFCIGCLFLDTIGIDFKNGFFQTTTPFIIITAVTYLIFEVITNRGFKKFWISVLRYSATTVCVIGIFILVKTTNGFGAETRVPSTDEVQSVSVNYYGYFDSITESPLDRNYGYNYKSQQNLIELKEKQNIQTIIDMHQEIINNYVKQQDNIKEEVYSDTSNGINLYSNSDIIITYKLKFGTSITRKYDYLKLDEFDILKNLDFQEEYRNQYIDKFINSAKVNYNTYVQDILKAQRSANGRIYQPAELNILKTLSNIPVQHCDLRNVDSLDAAFFDKFINAYEEDMRSETAEQYFKTKEPSLGYLNYPKDSFVIRPYYKNTISLLSEYSDFDPKLPTNYEEALSKDYIAILSYDDYVELTGAKTISTISSFFEDFSSLKLIQDYNEDVNTLINVSTDQYITNDKCYTIKVNENTRIIPQEYNDLAKKVYDSIEVNNSELSSYLRQ